MPNWKVPETVSLSCLQDWAWISLSTAPIRRALLTRDRSDRLVRIASDVLSSDGCYSAASMHEGYRKQVEDTVRGVYAERCSGMFATFVLSWAISAIVQCLVKRWLENRGGK